MEIWLDKYATNINNASVSIPFPNLTTLDGWNMIWWRYWHKPILRQKRRIQEKSRNEKNRDDKLTILQWTW